MNPLNRMFRCNIPMCKFQCNSKREFHSHQYNKHGTLVEESNSIFFKGDEIKQVIWTNSQNFPLDSFHFKPKTKQQLIQHCANRHMFNFIQRENYIHCEYFHILKRNDSRWDRHNKSKECAVNSKSR